MEQIFILQCPEPLAKFRAVISELDMPTIDEEAAIQVIVEGLRYEDHAADLFNAAKEISQGERLFEQDDEDSGVQSRIYAATLRLGSDIKNKLREHHAYRDGEFHYTFGKFMNHDTFYLTRRDAV